MNATTRKAVVMARGLGTRMRRATDDVLDDGVAHVAQTGMKAMIPVGRPFLEHLLTALADAGWTRVCLVIGPEHDVVREHFASLRLERVQVEFVVQAEPLGTADAVLAARDFAGGEPVLVVNGDNYYPVEALRRLAEAGPGSTVGFERAGLVAHSNIPAERVRDFAILLVNDGVLVDIVEKPGEREDLMLGFSALVSMNCWWFTPAIFDAAAAVQPSARGELELPDAVRLLVAGGDDVRVVPVSAGVLDLSQRGDIAAVTEALADRPVML